MPTTDQTMTVADPALYPTTNPILVNGQWNQGGLASMKNSLGYVDPWQVYHEGVDLGDGQVWFADPSKERIGTADVGYGFATAPGQKIASVTSPDTSDVANYDWLGQKVKQGVVNNGQTGFTVAKEDVPYLYGAMTQTGRDNSKYAAPKKKGLGGLGGLLGLALSAWNPLGLGLIGTGALGGAVGGGLASGSLKGALTGGVLGAAGGAFGNYVKTGSFLGDAATSGALNNLQQSIATLSPEQVQALGEALPSMTSEQLMQYLPDLSAADASLLTEINLGDLYSGSDYLNQPLYPGNIDPVDEVVVTAENQPFNWPDVAPSVGLPDLTKVATSGVPDISNTLPDISGGPLDSIVKALKSELIPGTGVSGGSALAKLLGYLQSRQGAVNNAKQLQNARAAQHSAAFGKSLSPVAWNIPTPRSLDSVTFKGYADGGSVQVGLEGLNFNSDGVLVGDWEMDQLRQGAELWNKATGQNLTPEQYDCRINPTTCGARSSAAAPQDYSQMVKDAYANIDRSGSQIDQAGLDYWTSQLTSGALKPSDFQKTFTSAALQNKDQGALTDLVNDAYGSLHRTGTQIDQPGFDYWVNQLKSGALNQTSFMPAFSNAAKVAGDGTTTTTPPPGGLQPGQWSSSGGGAGVVQTPSGSWASAYHPTNNLPATADRNYAGFQRFAKGGEVGCSCGGLNSMSGYLRGGSPGQADDVPISASHGEYVFDADTVAALGDGNNEAGAAALDQMRQKIRQHKRAAPANKIPPKAKAPEAYLPKKGKNHG